MERFSSAADDFEREVEQLLASVSVEKFLEERSVPGRLIPLAEIEKEIGLELQKEKQEGMQRSHQVAATQVPSQEGADVAFVIAKTGL